jgi:hypothetical protein
MSCKRSLPGAGSWVPQPDRVVVTPRRKNLAVRRKGQSPDLSPAKSLKKIVLTLLAVPVPARVFDRSAITEDGFTSPQGTYRWPLSLCLQEPDRRSQTRIVWSRPPDARSCPSAETATARTHDLQNRSSISTHFADFTTKTLAGTSDLSHDHQGRVYWPSRHSLMAFKLVLAGAGS